MRTRPVFRPLSTAALAALFFLQMPSAEARLVCRDLFANGAVARTTPAKPRVALRDRSPYFTHAKGLSMLDLQWHSLNLLANNERLPQSLRNIALEKLRYFKRPANDQDFVLALEALHVRERTILSIDYAFRTFKSESFDSQFRTELRNALTSSLLRSPEAIEALLPIARGASFARKDEPYRAIDAISEIAIHTPQIPRTLLPDDMLPTPEHKRLANAQIVELKERKGSANTVLFATLKDGKAVFKPSRGELDFDKGRPEFISNAREVTVQKTIDTFLGNKTSRESGASKIIVPASIESFVKEGNPSWGIGFLQSFQTGFVTLKDFMAQNPKEWDALRNTPAWHQTEARVRTIDYILGNHDRFPNSYYKNGNFGNLMISYDAQTRDFKVAMIDNSLGRPGQPWFTINDVPLAEHIPSDLAEAILDFDALAFSKAMQDYLPENGIEDFIKRVFDVQIRLRRHPKYGPLLKPINPKARGGKIGLIFGTMDPLHEGHLSNGLTALKKYGFDEIVVVPNFNPGHKPNAKSIAHRMNLAAIHVNLKEGFNLYSGPSSDLLTQRDGMRKFIQHIQSLYGTKQEVVELIGLDAYQGILPQGEVQPHMPRRLLVFRRGSSDGNVHIPPGTEKFVRVADGDGSSLSSTLMRKKIKSGEPVPASEMPPETVEYAQHFNLYTE